MFRLDSHVLAGQVFSDFGFRVFDMGVTVALQFVSCIANKIIANRELLVNVAGRWKGGKVGRCEGESRITGHGLREAALMQEFMQ